MPKTYKVTAENAKELRAAMKDKNNSRFYAKLQSVARVCVRITDRKGSSKGTKIARSRG